MATLADILNDPPAPHVNAQGENFLMGLTESALRFLNETVDQSSVTLETGSGISTIVFALAGAQHTCITPAAYEFDNIKSYCSARGIPTAQVNFVAGGSEFVLPTLDLPPLDLVLIDGRHGFPAPYIDWFYTATKLKVGGHMIVDDTWVWTCQILSDFLVEQPQWELVAEFDERTAVFRKVGAGSETVEWTEQPKVALGGRMQWYDGRTHYQGPSRLQRVLTDVRHGDLSALRRKVGRRLKRTEK
ncbi:MAG TPA: class I SAM-dependent methyltransferase [Pyrinomonadaceae bacterium]|jgi:hypothetical protein